MDDLVTFLRQCLDDVERVARRAQEIRSAYRLIEDPPSWEIAMQQALACTDTVKLDCAWEHLRTNGDPARVLRDVAAKRAIVDEWERVKSAEFPNFEGGYASAIENVIGHLVAVYSDREGYRPEWATDPID